MTRRDESTIKAETAKQESKLAAIRAEIARIEAGAIQNWTEDLNDYANTVYNEEWHIECMLHTLDMELETLDWTAAEWATYSLVQRNID